ncbi:hypothetical protein, partial [Escherichia coli]|uniref:hypothetical protein n=1 Tax=Escherichia coli TaxID=562 RepID=UPI001A8EC5F3
VSIKNDGHYFCRAGGNRPDGLNEPVTVNRHSSRFVFPGNNIRQTDAGTYLKHVMMFCYQKCCIFLSVATV